MEIYEIYSTLSYTLSMLFSTEQTPLAQALIYGLVGAFLIWTALFILQGVGLYVMAKKQGLKKKWLAFIPFVNILYMGKIAGETFIFGQRMKRPGLYAMIAQIVTTALCFTVMISEIYLCANCNVHSLMNLRIGVETECIRYSISRFYDISQYFLSIAQLCYTLLMLLLLSALYKKYSVKNQMVFTLLSCFVPISRFIIIFVLRNNKAVDYQAYMRARREAYMRQQQQYRNQYGPYNPYNNPYNNPYGQNRAPYGQNPYNPQSQNRSNSSSGEPFEEFSSSKNQNGTQSGGNTSNSANGDDGFFD